MKKIYSLGVSILILSSAAFAQGPPPPGTIWSLSDGDMELNSWPSTSPAGIFPPGVKFLQYGVNSNTDPTASDEPASEWLCRFNLTGRSRFVGANDTGIVFVNTGQHLTDLGCDSVDGNGNAGNKVGVIQLTLGSLGRNAVTVDFKTGITLQSDGDPEQRVYEIVLQGRTDTVSTTPWTNIPSTTYSTAGAITNASVPFSGIVLPTTFDNLNAFQLRWKVYQTSTTGVGTRPRIKLDDIKVSSSIFIGVNETLSNTKFNIFPNPANGEIFFSQIATGRLLDVSGREIVSFQNTKKLSLAGIAAGIYTLHCTNGETIKISVK